MIQKPPSVQFALSQNYKFKLGGMEKLVNSLITLHCDSNGKIIK
jgi:hypothetical protein